MSTYINYCDKGCKIGNWFDLEKFLKNEYSEFGNYLE